MIDDEVATVTPDTPVVLVGHSLGDRPPRLESGEGLAETVPPSTHGIPDDEIPF